MALVLSSSANMEESSYSEISDAKSPIIYAGFWLRSLAALVDCLVLFIPLIVFELFAVVAVKLVTTGKPTYQDLC
jgi:hypothetical protein